MHQDPDDRRPEAAPRNSGGWRVAVSALVAIALVALLFLTLHGSGSKRRPGSQSAQSVTAVAPSRALDVSLKTGSVVASIGQATPLRATPGGRVIGSLSAHTRFGTSRVVPVVRANGGWLGVIAPELANGQIGWLRQARTPLAHVRYTIRVQVRSHRLTVFHDGRPARSMSVGVGRSSIPTPIGQFAVTDKLYFQPLSAAYGCCALALSAHEYHLPSSWTGENIVAIHSTPDASSIGQSLSHGCVRVSADEGRWLVANIPLGTVVTIRNS